MPAWTEEQSLCVPGRGGGLTRGAGAQLSGPRREEEDNQAISHDRMDRGGEGAVLLSDVGQVENDYSCAVSLLCGK